MAQANENDEEVLEQLVQAAETGDVAILRTLLILFVASATPLPGVRRSRRRVHGGGGGQMVEGRRVRGLGASRGARR